MSGKSVDLENFEASCDDEVLAGELRWMEHSLRHLRQERAARAYVHAALESRIDGSGPPTDAAVAMRAALLEQFELDRVPR